MQRQDDYLITKTAMLMFIMQMMSLAGLAFRLAAQSRPVDDLLLRSFLRAEHVMLVLLAGILGNVDTRSNLPGLDEFEDPPDSLDRQAELLRFAASFQQIAMSLAVLLAMNPRAFRDRARSPSFRGGHSLPSFRGGAAEPGIQGWEGNGLAPAPMKPNLSHALRHYISGTRIKSGMTASSAARGPP